METISQTLFKVAIEHLHMGHYCARADTGGLNAGVWIKPYINIRELR